MAVSVIVDTVFTLESSSSALQKLKTERKDHAKVVYIFL